MSTQPRTFMVLKIMERLPTPRPDPPKQTLRVGNSILFKWLHSPRKFAIA